MRKIKAMEPLFIDIETTYTTDPLVVQRIGASIKPPGNYKKEDTIAKWEAEEKPGIFAKAVSETALGGEYGRIVCLGLAIDDGPIASIFKDEATLLAHLMSLPCEHGAFPVLVGHNLISFDLRLIRQRCIVHGVKLAPWWPRELKPWGTANVFDTMVAWADRERISLNELAYVLGIEVKPTLSGSEIPQAFYDGRLEAIREHNTEDIRVTREVYRKLSFV